MSKPNGQSLVVATTAQWLRPGEMAEAARGLVNALVGQGSEVVRWAKVAYVLTLRVRDRRISQ